MDTGARVAGGGYFHVLYFLHLPPAPPDQQPVAVHAVGRTGHQSHQVHALLCAQITGIRRLHHGDLVHLIAESVVKYREEKVISRLQLVQIREQSRAGQVPVGGYHRMGPLSAYRERAPLQMPCRFLQHFLAGGMEHRKLHIDLGNLHVAHHAVPGQVQAVHICLVRRL